jgi:hypothetical protein
LSGENTLAYFSWSSVMKKIGFITLTFCDCFSLDFQSSTIFFWCAPIREEACVAQ